MKRSNFVCFVAIGLALALSGVGCKHKPAKVTPLPEGSGAHVGDPGAGAPIGGQTGGEGVATPMANPADWANAARDDKFFEAHTVHFDYDSSVVKSSEKAHVAAVADHLKGNPGTGLEIEGHCDERGTDQYNYSLGERRALAVREELILLGVDGGRILTKSYGRSRPVDDGPSEAAHARNRRGVFVLLTK